MNKKLIFGSLLIFSMIGLVFAIQVGQTITQSQLDQIDIDTIELDEHFLRNGNNKVIYNCNYKGICTFKVNIKDLMRLENGDYEVIERTEDIKIRAKTFIEIKNEQGMQEARNQLVEWLKMKRDEIVNEERVMLKEFQTQQLDFDEIIDGAEI